MSENDVSVVDISRKKMSRAKSKIVRYRGTAVSDIITIAMTAPEMPMAAFELPTAPKKEKMMTGIVAAIAILKTKSIV
jgi:hypothetical protein